MAPNFEDIGARIRAVRKAMGKRQGEMAEYVGVAFNTYNQWEKGVRRPNLDSMIMFCDRTDTTLDYVYTGDFGGLPYDLAQRLKARLEKEPA